jgi:hypothetical protein
LGANSNPVAKKAEPARKVAANFVEFFITIRLSVY